MTLTGTAPDGATVTVSDGGATALGTATASSTGAWSFTTADLAAGSYAFTATDTTSAGTSAASSAFDVTVTPPTTTTTVIQTDTNSFGSTSLTEVGKNYFLNNSSGSDPELTYAGAPVVAGQFVGWTPIGAVQTATGYDVAWENTERQ